MAVRFLVPDSCVNPARHFSCAHWIGQERFVGLAPGTVSDGIYTVDEVPRCGRHLQLPWSVAGIGEVYIRAPQLMERDAPYRLTTELARGQLAQVKEYLASARISKDTLPEHIQQRMKKACDSLFRSVRMNGDPNAEDCAQEALREAVLVGEEVALFQCQESSSHSMVGVVLNDPRCFQLPLDSFQHATIPVCWRTIEAEQGKYKWDKLDKQINRCVDLGIPFTLGPLIAFSRQNLPEWLSSWDDDAELVVTLMSNFVETVIHRYESKVTSWETTAGVNPEDLFQIGEEMIGHVLVQLLRVAEDLAPDAQLILTIDQPWSEFLLHSQRRFPTFCLVDTLLRCAPAIRALNIEVAMGYPSWGGQRTLLDFTKMLDRYGELGVPLRVRLYFPSQAPLPSNCDPARFTQQRQAEWLEKHVLIARSKPFVELVSWGAMMDNDCLRWPHSGLVDAHGQAKDAFSRLVRLCDAAATLPHGTCQ